MITEFQFELLERLFVDHKGLNDSELVAIRCAIDTIDEQKSELATLRQHNQGLTSTCDHLQKAYDSFVVACQQAEAERDALREQLEAAQPDAARYRWLREHHEDLYGESSDAAIDAAIAKEPDQNAN